MGLIEPGPALDDSLSDLVILQIPWSLTTEGFRVGEGFMHAEGGTGYATCEQLLSVLKTDEKEEANALARSSSGMTTPLGSVRLIR